MLKDKERRERIERKRKERETERPLTAAPPTDEHLMVAVGTSCFRGFDPEDFKDG